MPAAYRDLKGDKVWLIEPSGRHTHSLIYLHGFGEDNDGSGYPNVREFFHHPSLAEFTGLRILCPDAPVRPISVYAKEEMRSWYDYRTDHEGAAEDDLDDATLADSCNRIHLLVEQEAKALGNSTKVFVGGCSQGCITAFHAVATLPKRLVVGAFVGCVGHVLTRTPLKNLSSRVKDGVYFFQGENDAVMQWQWVKDSFLRLEKVDTRVHIRRWPGVGHVLEGCEGEMLQDFLASVMPPPSFEEQLDAMDRTYGGPRVGGIGRLSHASGSTKVPSGGSPVSTMSLSP